MPSDQKYFVGESLREKLRTTIARVDGMPQGGRRVRIPTVIEGVPAFAQKTFRMGTFTGTWAINSAKTVTFRGVTATPNTVSVQNTLVSLGDATATECAIAKDGTAWYLVAWPPQPGIVRGTFTAPWAKGSTKTVTDAVTSGKTYENVKNYFAAVGGTGTKACAITYVGNEWILIAAEC